MSDSTETTPNPWADKYTVQAAVAHAISGQPLDFENATKHILAQKMQDAVDAKREEVAKSMFGNSEAEAPEVEAEAPEVEAETEDNTGEEEASTDEETSTESEEETEES
jgi:hypothetical protein